MLTKQDILTTVIGFYAKGGLPGYDESMASCSYFAADGGRCAVGVLLETLDFTEQDVAEVAHEDAHRVIKHLGSRLTDKLEPDAVSFLSHMQTVHDWVADGGRAYDEASEESYWPEGISEQVADALREFGREHDTSV